MRAGGATVVILIIVCMTPYWIGSKRQPAAATEQVATEGHENDQASRHSSDEAGD